MQLTERALAAERLADDGARPTLAARRQFRSAPGEIRLRAPQLIHRVVRRRTKAPVKPHFSTIRSSAPRVGAAVLTAALVTSCVVGDPAPSSDETPTGPDSARLVELARPALADALRKAGVRQALGFERFSVVGERTIVVFGDTSRARPRLEGAGALVVVVGDSVERVLLVQPRTPSRPPSN